VTQRWRGAATNPKLALFLLVLFPLAGLAPLLAEDPDGRPWIWGLDFVIACIGMSFAWVEVRVEDDGIVVRMGPGGLFPIKRIPRSEIASVRAITVRPLANYAGWGIRYGGVPGVDRGWAIIVRAGDALLIERPNKKPFVVTVDDPKGAVAALSARSD
jgi:hypothetical protein